MNRAAFEQAVRGAELTDVYLTGFVELGGQNVCFVPMLRCMVFEFGAVLLRASRTRTRAG